MRLRDYLKQEGITQVSFAKKLGLTQAHFSRLLHARMLMPLAVAVQIVKLTHGNVTYEDMVQERKK